MVINNSGSMNTESSWYGHYFFKAWDNHPAGMIPKLLCRSSRKRYAQCSHVLLVEGENYLMMQDFGKCSANYIIFVGIKANVQWWQARGRKDNTGQTWLPRFLLLTSCSYKPFLLLLVDKQTHFWEDGNGKDNKTWNGHRENESKTIQQEYRVKFEV